MLKLSMATRFLTLGAATIISCLLVSLGMYQYRQAMQMANGVNRRMLELSAWLEEEELLQYDGVLFSGVEVVSFYKRYFDAGEGLPEFQLLLHQYNQELNISAPDLLDKLQQKGSYMYCDPRAIYQCNVVRNSNDLIRKVCFVKQ